MKGPDRRGARPDGAARSDLQRTLPGIVTEALLPTPSTRNARGADPRDRTAGKVDLQTAVLLPTPTVTDARGGRNATAGRTDPKGSTNTDSWTLSDVAYADLLPTPRATDGTKGGPNQRGTSGDLMLPSAAVRLLPTPTVGAASQGPGATGERTPTLIAAVDSMDWGRYAAAIARWEQVVGRPAPPPTEPGRTGRPRLAAPFVEWMMGLPAGWVTAVPGLSRNAQLRILGGGLVPQQGARGYRKLITERGRR